MRPRLCVLSVLRQYRGLDRGQLVEATTVIGRRSPVMSDTLASENRCISPEGSRQSGGSLENAVYERYRSRYSSFRILSSRSLVTIADGSFASAAVALCSVTAAVASR